MKHLGGGSGFGLTELLVAVAISAIMALSFSSVFQLMSTNSNNFRGGMGAQSLRAALIQGTSPVIQQPSGNTACINNLLPGYRTFNATQANTPAGMPIGFLANDGVSHIAAGPTPTPLVNYNVSVSNLNFIAASAGPSGTNPTTNNPIYMGTLVLGLSAITGSHQPMPKISVETLSLEVDSNNNIVNCYNLPSNAISACTSLGGTYVATANPPCEVPYQCGPGLVFTGYVSNVPTCVAAASLAALTCSGSQTVVYDGSSWGCQ